MSVRFPVLVLFSLCHILCVSCFGSYHVVFVWFDFAVLGIVSSVASQKLGRGEGLRNDLFSVDCGLKP